MGGKISIEIHDNLSSLNYSYEQYGTMTLIPTKTQREFMGIHFIAAFSGELSTGIYSNSLMFFPATFKDNPTVGRFVDVIEFVFQVL